jgi:membrane fusion protein (multidrug efflux system)
MEYAMKTKYVRLSIFVVAVALLAVSLVGANLALTGRAEGDGKKEETREVFKPPVSDDGAVCIAYVDVEERVRDLYPTHPGKVVDVLVREGQRVTRGTVLFRMEDQPARALVAQAKADLRASESRLNDARKLPNKHQLDIAQQRQVIVAKQQLLSAERIAQKRVEKLVKVGGASQEEVDAAPHKVKASEALVAVEEENLRKLELIDPGTDVSRAEADLAAKQAQLDSAEFALAECSIKAPADGEILRLLVGAGEMLGSLPKQPAVQFLPAGPRIVRAEVEQEFANRVSKGQSASVQDDSKAGPTWHGKVVRISDWYTHRRSIVQEPLQFNDVRTLECIIELDPQKEMPRIGQRMRVVIGSLTAQK